MSVADYLGPYGRVAYGFVNEKAHYALDQRGAWLTAWCMTGLRPPRDGTVKLKALRAVIGEELLDFLIEEGDLAPTEDPELLKFTNFEWANEPMERNRRNVAAYRDRQRGQGVDNVTESAPSPNGNITSDVVSSSPSLLREPSTTKEDHPVVDGGDHDALDRYYELTLVRPWGRNSGRWLGELQAAHGVSNVFAALEVEHRDDPKIETLLSRVAARLERQADRVAQAKRREPKPVDPLQAQIREALAAQEGPQTLAEPLGDPEEGRRAFEALRGSLGHRGGPLTPVGAVVSSLQNGSTGNGRSLTVDKGAGRKSAAAVPSGTESGIAPSLRRPATVAAEIYSRAEPGEPAPNRSEASTDEATKKEKAP